jgi:hypothetical protein
MIALRVHNLLALKGGGGKKRPRPDGVGDDTKHLAVSKKNE